MDYFKSEADEIIFYLVELDGQARLDKLKITPFHYHNVAYAEKWFIETSEKIKGTTHPHAERARKELSTMHLSMIRKN